MSFFSKTIFALSVVAGFQQAHAAGDQTGLLDTLYNTKGDYLMNMNKGVTENASLSQMVEQIYTNLKPYEGQQVQMSSDFYAPIQQTVVTFGNEEGTENQAIKTTMANVDATVSRLADQQKGTCDAVSMRYQDARQEMVNLWNLRSKDSVNLRAELTSVADDTSRSPGLFLVQADWLQQILAAHDASEAARQTYASRLQALDANLSAIIEDIRVCFDLD